MAITYLREDKMSDHDYFKQVLADADKLTVSVRWCFDEQQAEGFHHQFTSHEFFRRLKRLVDSTSPEIKMSGGFSEG